ncbi:hypothetical protein V8E54_003811 [Elaphomyces granulatus]
MGCGGSKQQFKEVDLGLPDLGLPGLPDLELQELQDLGLQDLGLPDLGLPDLGLPDLELPRDPDLELDRADDKLPNLGKARSWIFVNWTSFIPNDVWKQSEHQLSKQSVPALWSIDRIPWR